MCHGASALGSKEEEKIRTKSGFFFFSLFFVAFVQRPAFWKRPRLIIEKLAIDL